MSPVLFSVAVSPLHPDFSSLYAGLGLQELRFDSERKAIQGLKKDKPAIVIADFIYGYGNNYAGVNVSNLDVLFHSLQMQAPDAKLIVFSEKSETRYVSKLDALFPLCAVFEYPVTEAAIKQCLVDQLKA